MRSRKEALLITLRSFRNAPAYIAMTIGWTFFVCLISYGAKMLADWASPDAGKVWITVFLASYIGAFALIALIAYCWGTYQKARQGDGEVE